MDKARHITSNIRYFIDDYLKTSSGELNILGKLIKILIVYMMLIHMMVLLFHLLYQVE